MQLLVIHCRHTAAAITAAQDCSCVRACVVEKLHFVSKELSWKIIETKKKKKRF